MDIGKIIKKIKGKGVVKNYSTNKSLWVIESDNNKYVSHKLGPRMRSPYKVDADGFRRTDNKSIEGHNWWWKIWGHTTADIADKGNTLLAKVIIKFKINKKDDPWKDVIYDDSDGWGVPIINIVRVKKDKNRIIGQYLVEEYGWLSKKQTIKLAQKGLIDNVVVVKSRSGKGVYLRSCPDSITKNNFSNMVIS